MTNYDARLAQLLDDMRDTLEDAQGYGLAAPQVGVMRRVFISVDERDLPENGERPEGYETKFLEFVNPEIIAQEGDVLHYGGYSLQAVETPGHTPGHMCLYDAEKKLLFCGDHILGTITPNICIELSTENPLQDYLARPSKGGKAGRPNAADRPWDAG